MTQQSCISVPTRPSDEELQNLLKKVNLPRKHQSIINFFKRQINLLKMQWNNVNIC